MRFITIDLRLAGPGPGEIGVAGEEILLMSTGHAMEDGVGGMTSITSVAMV